MPTRTRKAYVRRDRPVEYRKNLVKARGDAALSEYERQLLEAARRGANDFKYFCEVLLGLRVHSGQLRVTELMAEKDYGVLAAANGWGKTLFYALLMLWASFYKKWAPSWWQQYKAVVLGPELAQALITHGEIEQIRLGRHAGQMWREETGGDGKMHKCLIADRLIPFTTSNKHLAFQWRHNGAQLFFETAKEKASSIEGWAINLLIFDEARLEHHLEFIVNEVVLARGVRAPGMKILLGSTPLSTSYAFREYYLRGVRGDENWWSKSGTINENIFLDAEQVEKIRRAINDPRVERQVMSGEFVEDPESYFVIERVLECMNEDQLPPADIDLYGGKATKGHLYVGGLDIAVAEGGDWSVVTLWDITTIEGQKPCRVIFEKRFPKGTALSQVVQYCDILIQEFNCQIGYDATSGLGVEFGHQVSLQSAWYIPIKFGGHSTDGKSVAKMDALANFKYMINNKLWSCPNLEGLKAELVSYKLDDKDLLKDRLMAQVYAAWVAKDYINASLESGYFDDVGGVYSGEAGPFQQISLDPNMSATRRRFMQIVEQSKQRDAAERTAKELSGG